MEQRPESSTQVSKHMWTVDEDELLVQCLVDLRIEGKFLGENGFRLGHLGALESRMEAKSPGCGLKGIPHIQSRLKTFRTSWSTVYDMVYGPNTSGFGWDPIRKCVTAEKEVWDEYVKTHKKATPFRCRPFPYFEELCLAFGKDRATGRDVAFASDIVEDLDAEEEGPGLDDVVDTEMPHEIDQDTPSFNLPQHNKGEPSSRPRKRRKTSSDQSEHMAEVIKAVGATIDNSIQLAMDKVCTRVDKLAHKVAMDERVEKLYAALLKVDGLLQYELYEALGKIASDDKLLVLFPTIPDETKADWIRHVLG